MVKNIEEKKKRGRKPKIQSTEVPVVVEKKKRGRKPKTDLSTVPIKQSKDLKKEKSYGNKQVNETNFSSEHIILHLPVHSNDIIDNSLNDQMNDSNNIIDDNIPKETETTGLKNMNLKWIENKDKINNNIEFASYPFNKTDETLDTYKDYNKNLLLDNDINSIDIDIDNSKLREIQETRILDYQERFDMYSNCETNKEGNDDSFNNNNSIDSSNQGIKFTNNKNLDNNSNINNDIINWSTSNDINVQHVNNWYDTSELDNNYERKTDILMEQFVESSKTNTWPNSTPIHCYWCCHQFQSRPCALPLLYEKDVYKVFGCFCSPECAAAYNFNDLQDTDLRWERYSLLNMLYKKVFSDSNIQIKLAPSSSKS